MSIRLTVEHLRLICSHAESTYPHECCGLLLGKLSQDDKILVEAIATENVWNPTAAADFQAIEPNLNLGTQKNTYYTIAPEVMLKVQKEARDRQLDIIGIYHSHPNHPAIPSEFDRLCGWQAYSYIIVSVLQGKARDVLSWSLDDNHQFQPEEIVVERLI
ncbi:M67 family metallopeptidase [Chroococcidiopsis sp. FACHB-1243]|uniref:Mov34/MPN/PAD-1 family protein n=1 Tax=Chroococcidiopsis sp. [FACHB-1243] TaxID=2692781 RepID=UPI001781324F|nr:M67 family metallopeptidase [Chroococcidiopsis sp. [FACHB-1243]]